MERQKVERTLKKVTTPIISLKMLLSQWGMDPEISNYRITPESRITKVIDDLTNIILSNDSISLKSLRNLELLHMKLNAGHEQTWLKLTFTETIENTDDFVKWAEFGYHIDYCEARGMHWWRLERKSNEKANYVVVNFENKTIWLRRGMFGNARTTNLEFCKESGMESCFQVLSRNDITLNNTSFNSSVLQNSIMNSVNMSQALGTSTQNPVNVKSNNLLGSINELTTQIPHSRHENIKLKITSLKEKTSLLDAFKKSCKGDINPSLLKKQRKRKLAEKGKSLDSAEIVLKKSELLNLE